MKQEYITPQIEILHIQSEGLLCSSNELLDENYGEW